MNWAFWVIQGLAALQTLFLGLVAGGILGLGAFTAPGLFKTLDRASAGLTMTKIFRKFDGFMKNIVYTILLLQLVIDLIAGYQHPKLGLVLAASFSVKFLVVSILFLITMNLVRKNKQLEEMVGENGEIFSTVETAENTAVASFQKLHKASEKESKLVCYIAIVLILWNVVLPISLFLLKH
jgi:Domain of unknown function (DUF4149)